jgi:amino acid adenylation domain-containing protein
LQEQGINLRTEGDRLICAAPAGTLSTDLRTIISQHKAEILFFLRSPEGINTFSEDRLIPSVISRRSDSQSAPLSFAQQRLWFLQQLEPDSSAYHITQTWRLQGPLHLDALQQALATILERHESLRTYFVATNGFPRQMIAPLEVFELPLIDLSAETSSREERLKSQLEEEAHRPFDLTSGLMLRATLIRLSEEQHVLQIVMHHIASDGWSMNILNRELPLLYLAFASGQPSPLPKLTIQYADFAAWQRQWLVGDVLESQLSYWKQQLSGAPPLLELPTDYPRPPQPSYRGAQLTLTISQSLTKALKRLSQQTGTTLFITLLAAFNTLLYRYTQQDDIVVGSPIANRNRMELEGLIGFFANTLALRTDLSGNPSFRELLERVRQVAFGAYAHQDVPFEKLVEELQPERNLSYSPLFQVMLVLQNAPRSAQRLADLHLQPEPVENATAKFDLTLSMSETAEGLRGVLEYSTDLFEAATIERMVGHFQTLLEGIVANPEQSIATLPILTAAERQQLLVEWNETQTDYPRDKCIHQLFEEQVERTPDAIAVIFEEQQLTYQQLNRRANQLAHHLQTLGVGRDQLVGICLERSIELVVGLLGILKAGGTYLPLDPTYPQPRLAFMVENAQAQVIVTQDSLRQVLPPAAAHVVCLDTDWSTIAQQPTASPCSAVQPQNLAYVIYTSGSTGQPKGVLLNHRPLVNLVAWQVATSTLPVGARTLQFTPVSFDVSFQEIFATWCAGGTLVLIADDQRKDAIALIECLQDSQIERLFLPFVALQHLAEIAQSRHQVCPALREVITAGEQLQITPAIAQWFSQHPHCRLHNHYGPSETHVVTAYPLSADPQTWSALPPIGKALPQTQLFVLDPQGQPVPIGVAGELFIGVEDAVRGYIHRPDLTQSRFIPNPFRPNGGDRLYKTGDLVRYLPDGNIEFLGRIDQQVKIRGFRIELSEVETALSQHPAVQSAVVLAREDEPGDKRMVAYVVLTDTELATAEFRQFLQRTLPDYMIPAAFVRLEALPLTPNGKVDRRALPKPDASDIQAAAVYVAPRNPLEQQLAQVWAEVLKLEQVGIHDNFFELGGHSLLAMQVIARMQTACQVNLSLRRLFATSTIAGLAESVDQSVAQPDEVLPAIVRRSDSDAAPLSFAQQRLWFLQQLEPESPAYHITRTLRLQGPVNCEALQQAFTTILERHEALRTCFVATDGIPQQVIASPDTFELLQINLRAEAPAQPEQMLPSLLDQNARRPFDLTADLMLRATLIRLSEEDHVLQIVMHHIAADGWSMGVFTRELSALYQAYCHGQANPLPELPIQYADFAAWQRQWLQGDTLERYLTYWQETLQDITPLELPTDYPRPAIQAYRGQEHSLVLAPELTRGLKTLSQGEEVTLFMTLLAAFKLLLARLSGQNDVVVGSPIAGRNQVETESLIGFFINTVVLRTDLSGQPSFLELLARVKQVALGAYAHQELPFEKLVEELQPERDLSRNPFFQVWVNMLNLDSSPVKLADLKIETIVTAEQTSKFDLTLYISEKAEELRLNLVSNADLFSEERMEELLRQYEYLLQQITTNPACAIGCYSLVTSAKASILPNPNELLRSDPGQVIYHRFMQHSQNKPKQLAVVDSQGAWSYELLNHRSNQLAHYLHEQKIQSQDVVAIYGARSTALVWAIMGVLKAGAAFTILDPAYPEARLIKYLQIAQPKAWIALESAGPLPGGLAQYVDSRKWHSQLQLPTNWESIPECLAQAATDELSAVSPKPENLAYITFTSGSAGQPKGIVGTHRPVSHFLDWYCRTLRFNPFDRFSLLSGLSHDPLLRDIFTPLSVGGTLYIPSKTDIEIPSRLIYWMRQSEISVAHLTPAMGALIREGAAIALSIADSQLPALRYACFGGDILTSQTVSELKQLAPQAAYVNFYGATETPQVAGYFVIPDSEHQPELVKGSQLQRIPIGRGIDDVQLLVLNASKALSGIGEVGEICVRTPYLSQGYVNNRALTCERFFLNPFTGSDDDVYYKTGDLARYLPDGNIEFIGRIDHQVKIRGFRIELGEIEARLSQHPSVRQCVVIAREDEPGDKRLVAYAVTFEDEFPTTVELRQFLQRTLPDHLIPSAVVQMESLPLNPNGKIDRQALPKPEPSDIQAAAVYVGPRTPQEQQLADIWAEVLKLEQVGIYDNFFELGGHSLLATQVVARIQAVWRIKLSLRRLFEFPTIAELSHHMEATHRFNTSPIEPVDQSQPLPLSLPQQRLWLLDQLEGPNASYNMPLSLQLTGQLQLPALEQALQEVVRRHGSLRTTFVLVQGIPRQIVLPDLALALPVVDLQTLSVDEQETEVQRLAQQERQRPFDLAQGPLIRATLLKLGELSHVLLLTIHHIVSDGWSTNIFKRELTLLYLAFASGQPSPLPKLPIQYADFAVWQRQWLQGKVLEDQIAYWQNQLANAPPLLDLPTDRPRPPVQTSRGSTEPLHLSLELTQKLRSLGRACGCTLFMTLQAAFSTLLYRYSGQEDILIGSPIANRCQPEVEPLIGLFLNTLVLRTNLQGNPTFRELLHQVRQITLDAYAHQDVPFEQLLETLRPPRNSGYSPWFQVMLILNNISNETLALRDLTVTPLPGRIETAKFDLTLGLRETSQGLQGSLEYRVDLFEPITIRRMIEHFQNLLEGVVSEPDQHVAALPLLSETKSPVITNIAEPMNEAEILAMLLSEVEGLSEAEIQQLLSNESL